MITQRGSNAILRWSRVGLHRYCYGTLGMTREWLMNDNITPAETVARMMFGSMPERLRAPNF